ncbi:hypothetical protein Tco_1047393, partial [Tanacetum coccineum]
VLWWDGESFANFKEYGGGGHGESFAHVSAGMVKGFMGDAQFTTLGGGANVNMNHNVEKIDDNKEESQTMVMDDVLHVSGPEDNETESTNEVEEQLESKATNDPKVEDDSESMIENNKFVELDENTDDNKETQTVVMDHVQNPLILEDDEVKSLS